jgi:hypothetical protein
MEAFLVSEEISKYNHLTDPKSVKVKCIDPKCKHKFRHVVGKFVGTCKCGVTQEVIPPADLSVLHKVEKKVIYEALANIHEKFLQLYPADDSLREMINALGAVRNYVNPNQSYEDYRTKEDFSPRKGASRTSRKRS